MTDAVLHWMSFRRSGKIVDLCADLAGSTPARRVLGDLVTLGHVEMTGVDGWRVAPPVLAGLPQEVGSSAVLCGARTPALLESLGRASDAWACRLSVLPQSEGPAVVTVTAPTSDALVHLAESVGLPFQAEAGLHLLACSPSIREWPRTPFPMVEGKVDTVRRFSKSRMRWVASSLVEATAAAKGFFRIKRDWDWVSLLKSGPGSASVIDDRAGRMAAAAKCKVVRWTRDGGLLSLPAQLYPPGIMARGLALCSGELPRFDRETRQIAFAGVRPEHLRLFLALTGLRLI
ncbi:hypothetical protein NFI95_16070 [Acetobacteraceae bacterium KSS8]|uniref:Uncharacterized protein n=1 Tax=Endosaccharibacter trunci TaxID=2812733 RepID=A0ABT1WAP7_9PROT|nr:hypothetical protein [Acetobacteraceae bacterium KSS8]